MKKPLLAFILFSLSFSVVAKGKSEQQFSCDEGRKYCKEMSSCAEAKFYLNQCGMHKLDRDGDGIPCENVCKK